MVPNEPSKSGELVSSWMRSLLDQRTIPANSHYDTCSPLKKVAPLPRAVPSCVAGDVHIPNSETQVKRLCPKSAHLTSSFANLSDLQQAFSALISLVRRNSRNSEFWNGRDWKRSSTIQGHVNIPRLWSWVSANNGGHTGFILSSHSWLCVHNGVGKAPDFGSFPLPLNPSKRQFALTQKVS